jgi:hypothetical protein
LGKNLSKTPFTLFNNRRRKIKRTESIELGGKGKREDGCGVEKVGSLLQSYIYALAFMENNREPFLRWA